MTFRSSVMAKGLNSMFLQVLLIDPGQFRILNELLQKECKGGKIETLTFAATALE